MNPITDLWRQLVRRRLWPVALLLVGAIGAVPVLLAKDPEAVEPAASTAANVAAADDVTTSLATEPIVSIEEPDTKKHRAPLGGKHDIFKPTKKPPKAAKAPKPEKPAVEQKTGEETPEAAKDPVSSGGGGTTTPEPVATDKPETPKTYPAGSLLVRFNGKKSLFKRHDALPSNGSPLIIFLGLTDHDKTAVFLLDSTLKPQGDGECNPTPENCEELHLRVGETEFLDTVDATGASSGQGFELDLVKINKPKSSSHEAGRTASIGNVAGTVASAAAFASTATRSR